MRPSMWRSLVGATMGYSATKRDQLERCLDRAAVKFPARRASCESGLGKFPLMFLLERHDYPIGPLIAGALSYFHYMGARNVFLESNSSQTVLQKLHGYLGEMDRSFGMTKEMFNDVLYAVQARANIENPGSCSYTQEGFLKAIKAVGPEGVEEAFSELRGHEFPKSEEARIRDFSYMIWALSDTSEHELLSKSLRIFGERGVHNVDAEDDRLAVDSVTNPDAALRRNSLILGNILSKSDSGIYYGGVAHHGWDNAGIANILDVNYGKIDGVPKPKDVVFIYAKKSHGRSDEPEFENSGPYLYPLYVIDARDMTPKEFAEKCQDVIAAHRDYIDELKVDQQRGDGR